MTHVFAPIAGVLHVGLALSVGPLGRPLRIAFPLILVTSHFGKLGNLVDPDAA